MILVAAALTGANAHAQAFSVPPELERVISQATVDDAGQQAVRDFVQPRARDLEGGDPAAMGLAREDLIAPLAAGENISVSFRLTYAEALLPTLVRLAGGADEIAAIGALRIAGNLGTGQSVALLDSALDSASPAVRYAAAQGMGETLRLIAESNPALQAGAATQIVDRLGATLSDEANVHVADAIVRALDAPRQNAQLRQGAALVMASAMIEQIRDRRAEMDAAVDPIESSSSILRAIVNARSLFIDLGAGVPRNVAVNAGLLAGQAMAWGVTLIEAAGGVDALAAEEFEAVRSTLTAAEALAALANVSVGGDNIIAQPIAQALERRDFRALQAAVGGWTAPSGRLCRPPFGADPDDFE